MEPLSLINRLNPHLDSRWLLLLVSRPRLIASDASLLADHDLETERLLTKNGPCIAEGGINLRIAEGVMLLWMQHKAHSACQGRGAWQSRICIANDRMGHDSGNRKLPITGFKPDLAVHTTESTIHEL